VAEGMALGAKLGIDPQALAGVINSSTGRCWSSEIYNPWPDICANAPSSRGYTDGFAAQLMLKDLGLAVDAAQQVDQPVVLGSMVQKLYQQLCQEGDAHLDFSSIMHQYTTPPAYNLKYPDGARIRFINNTLSVITIHSGCGLTC